MPPVGFEPTISAGERPKTYALDRAANGTGTNNVNAFSKDFHSVHSCSQSLLSFQLNAHSMLTTHIYPQLPPTYFGVCYTIFRETIALLAQKLYAFCNVVTKVKYCCISFRQFVLGVPIVVM